MVLTGWALPDGAAGSARVLRGVPGEAEGTVRPRGLEASPCVSSSQGPPGKSGGDCCSHELKFQTVYKFFKDI